MRPTLPEAVETLYIGTEKKAQPELIRASIIAKVKVELSTSNCTATVMAFEIVAFTTRIKVILPRLFKVAIFPVFLDEFFSFFSFHANGIPFFFHSLQN